MFNKQIMNFFLLGLLLTQINLLSSKSYAQTGSRVEAPSVKSQVAKILLSSLGGAVLGISTLSFYDKPQDHLSNVAVGGVLGIVLGSIYVTRDSLEQQETTLSTLDHGGTLNLAFIPDIKKPQSINGASVSWGFSF